MEVKTRLTGDFKKIMRIRDKEIKRYDKATVKALERFGAIVRQDAKKLIGSPARTRNAKWKVVDGKKTFVATPPSDPRAPGSPPKARTGHEFYSLRNIRYVTDFAKRKVMIGPWNTSGKRYGSKTIPDLQEFGGTITTRVRRISGGVTAKDIKRRKGQLTQVSTRVQIIETSKGGIPAVIKIPKRPFMRPAYKRHKTKATKIWVEFYKASKRRN